MASPLASTRRALLAAGAAAALAPRLGWARAGAPAFLAAARRADGAYVLHGLSAAGEGVFALPLPGRGHAAAAHPRRAEAVAFARRPGRFALVIDCAKGRETARLAPPAGRVFCGHGAFTPDGALLFTTENAYEEGAGRLGVWDAAAGYARIGEVATGGVGPHEVILAPEGDALIVANGGILTHPDSGRAKLNLPTMRPNLSRIAIADGALAAQVEAAPALRRNSLRHLAARPDGLIACAAQWEGDLREAPPLLALWPRGAEALEWRAAPEALQRRTRGYAGSAAVSADGARVAFTAPRGGLALVFAGPDLAFERAVERPDICGAGRAEGGLLFTDGAGGVAFLPDGAGAALVALGAAPGLAWDNHLVPV
jgi:hypothetical protein